MSGSRTEARHDTGAAVRLVAAGVGERRDGRQFLRATLTLLPTASGPHALETWPEVMHGLWPGETIPLLVAPAATAWPAEGAWVPVEARRAAAPLPGGHLRDCVLDLWQRTMAPWGREDWDALRAILAAGCAAPPPRRPGETVSTTPAEAALAHTLERGRMVLDAMAGSGAPLLARAATRPPPSPFALAGRPWLGTPGPLERLAALTDPSVASDAGPDLLRAGRGGPDAAFPPPAAIADAALGLGGGMEAVFDRVHLAHHLATHPPEAAGPAVRLAAAGEPQPPAPAPSEAEEDAEALARRRYGALLAAPVLQRLFGLALDIEMPLDAFDGTIQSGVLLLCAPAGDARIATLARLRRGDRVAVLSFMPCRRDSAPCAGPHAEGVVDLGEREGDWPVYDICTVDPVLATEADAVALSVPVSAADGGGGRQAGGLHTLRNGGLRLINRRRKAELAARECRPEAPLDGRIEDAADLHQFDRLDVGLRVERGEASRIAWRCPMHRILRYRDPLPPPGATAEWLEEALHHLLGHPEGPVRLHLEAATLTSAVVEYDPDPKRRPSEAVRRVVEATVAAWGGEPMGTPCDADRRWPNGRPRPGNATELEPRETLAIHAELRLPGAREDRRWRAMPLTFGAPYHLGLRRGYQGGVVLPLAEAEELYGTGRLALPPAKERGRRFLRHERLSAPVLAVPSGGGDAADPTDAPKVRRAGQRVGRVILPPAVPLDFAALHGVFRGAATEAVRVRLPTRQDERTSVVRPRDGLREVHLDGHALPPPAKEGPKRFEVRGPGNPKPVRDLPWYPDPAASLLVLALALPREGRDAPPASWVLPPMVLPVGAGGGAWGGWPERLPVRLDLVGVAPGMVRPGNRLRVRPPGWLGRGEVFHATERGAREAGGTAVPARLVELLLEPGEVFELHAWFVPTIRDLAAIFDPVEAASLLAVRAGQQTGGSRTEAACMKGLAALLGRTVAAAAPEAERSCTGAASMPVPGPGATEALAGMLHAEMLARPLPVLTAAQVLTASHPARAPLAVPRFGDQAGRGRLTLVRRRFPGDMAGNPAQAGGETRLEFLRDHPDAADWSPALDEEGATGLLLGGEVSFDPATTGALEIRASCAMPDGLWDDPARGRLGADRRGMPDAAETAPRPAELGFEGIEDGIPQLRHREVTLLRLDGLPRPEDGRPGRRTYGLEELQAAAVAPDWLRPEGWRRLRVSDQSPFREGLARVMHLRPVAIPRFLPADAKDDLSPPERVTLVLRATQTPAPPLLHDVVPAFRHERGGVRFPGGFALHEERHALLRVRMRRGWWSSGEGERLGLVLWRPPLLARTVVEGQELPDLRDEDLGPGGAFVTRWGADPIRSFAAPTRSLLRPQDFEDTGQDSIRSAGMPLPKPAEGTATPDSMVVELLTLVPRLDLRTELWTADLALARGAPAHGFLRLGLVRYQPEARDDDLRLPGGVSLRCSPPVAEWGQMLPRRRVDVTCRSLGTEETEVAVTVSGPGEALDADSVLAVTLTRHRAARRGAPAQEVVARDAEGAPLRWSSRHPPLPNGAPARTADGWAWSCVFHLPGGLEAEGWHHAVHVEEGEALKPATLSGELGEPGEDHAVPGATRFAARLELMPRA